MSGSTTVSPMCERAIRAPGSAPDNKLSASLIGHRHGLLGRLYVYIGLRSLSAIQPRMIR